jgi:DNA-directed RNA polymerase subunit RPC12/RpoP
MHGSIPKEARTMKYYCASCNLLKKIEATSGEDDMVCDQCGHSLIALGEASSPVRPASGSLGLIVLIGVTGFLLGILWLSGGDKPDKVNTLGMVEDFFDAVISTVGAGVKIGLSLFIVSCAVLIGTKMAAPKHRISEATLRVEQPSEIKGARTGLRITSIVGMSLGTMMIVLTVVGGILFIVGAIWLALEILKALPFISFSTL